MAEVLGVIGDTLGIYSFVSSLFAAKSANTCVVRVAAALNGGALSGADGGINSVQLYNENQQLIGNRGGNYVGSGGFTDIYVNQPNTQQAAFATIGATNDAICIPYITSTWVDGSRYGWAGDWGYACGLDWYYGNVYVDNGQNKPRCTWIDNDHTNSIRAGMLFIHFPSFTNGYTEGGDRSNYCRWPALRAYTQNNGGSQIFKRNEVEGALEAPAHKLKRLIDTRIVVTSDPSHNATTLCESKTSRGPDLVSLAEKVYCNMETRETLPLCAQDGSSADCFDVESKQERRQSVRVMSSKDYTDVIVWD